MSDRLIDFLLARSPRERVLLGLLGGVALPLALIFGWLVPLAEARNSALRAEAEAQALLHWLEARVAEKVALDRVPAAAPRPPPIGSSGIEQSLIAASLRSAVSELGARGEGVIELRFDAVDFTDLANWLSAAERGWGYDIAAFRFEALDTPAKVRASVTLVPPE